MKSKKNPIREIGISKARGITAYFAFDQTKTFSTYRREGSVIDHTSTIDELFQKRLDAGDDRVFIAVLDGSLEYLRHFKETLTTPKLIVYLSTLDVLDELNIEVIDRKWESTQEKIDLNKYVPKN